jgi:hypothetical protein
MADAAMHMYSAAIDTLPDAHDPEFPHRAGIILAGLRKLQGSLSEAAGRRRVTRRSASSALVCFPARHSSTRLSVPCCRSARRGFE